jgi:hypothetical protein
MAAATASTRADTLVQRLLAGYDRIQTVTCRIRKDTATPNGKVRMLSRVFYRRPDRLHVENTIPGALSAAVRRIVSDGTNIHTHVEGDEEGFLVPVSELDDKMAIELRRVPGTAMDHLLRLRDAPEDKLPATPEFAERKGYRTPRLYAVLSLDAAGRLARVEFFRSAEMKIKSGEYRYSAFEEVLPGVWIPRRHQGRLTEAGTEIEETVRISDLAVNTPIAARMFAPDSFFPGVEFRKPGRPAP